jgi:Flp pilus assembly protein TadG
MKRVFTKPGIRNMASRFSTRRRRQRGTILLLTAVMLLGMAGFVVLSTEMGYLFSFRTQFQNGVDAAALAGAAGFRVTIEADAAMPQQASVVKALAVQFAGFNVVNRYNDPNNNTPVDNKLVLDPATVTIDTSPDIPRVEIDTNLQTPPFLFPGIVGLDFINVKATATASLFPVDGGTGTIGGGGSFSPCWRPLLLPDTFYDSGNNVQYVGGRADFPLPDQAGDYYRSRFAVGGRNVQPFIDGPSGSFVTGLRDTQLASEIGVRTIMGMNVTFQRDHYFIADFSGLPRATPATLSTGDLATYGYCGQIRVGDDIPVYLRTNVAIYDQVRIGLNVLKQNTNDIIDDNLRINYKYIKSASYPGPNTHGAIIPVLLYDPFLVNSNPTVLRVTNIGLFFLDSVSPDGTLRGSFVREIFASGTPISSANFGSNSGDIFRKEWLPMSVQLLK